MVNPNSKIAISFYTIKSDFNEVLLRVCKKILSSNENFYVNLLMLILKLQLINFYGQEKKEGSFLIKISATNYQLEIRLFCMKEVMKTFPCLKISSH